MINVKTSQGNIIIKFFLTVTLDNIDRAILESLKNSRRGRTASQIYAILDILYIRHSITICHFGSPHSLSLRWTFFVFIIPT